MCPACREAPQFRVCRGARPWPPQVAHAVSCGSPRAQACVQRHRDIVLRRRDLSTQVHSYELTPASRLLLPGHVVLAGLFDAAAVQR